MHQQTAKDLNIHSITAAEMIEKLKKLEPDTELWLFSTDWIADPIEGVKQLFNNQRDNFDTRWYIV